MLQTLEIQNFALIEKLTIDFESGLNILTGETGAGKSIIIDSINAVLGARLSKEIIRTGAQNASVTAVFTIEDGNVCRMLEESGVELSEGGGLIITREVSASGRGTLRANGRIVPVSLVKSVGELILDLHGQYDNHSLIKKSKHADLLDNFGGKEIFPILGEYGSCYTEYLAVSKRIAELSSDEARRTRDIDMLTYQINEIKNARIQLGEDEYLEGRIKVIVNAERILKALKTASDMLGAGEGENTGALACVASAVDAMADIRSLNGVFEEYCSRLADISYQLEDVLPGIRKSIGNVEYDPTELDKLSDRLDAIERLKKKYGGSIENMHAFCADAEKRLEGIMGHSQAIGGLKKEKYELGQKLRGLAARLTEARRNVAGNIEGMVGAELGSLEMEKSRFCVAVEHSDGYTHKGRDKIEFLFSANKNEDLKPLSKIASGGEMSRIMLAIKSVLANSDNIPTMIFDEIDTGISGKAGLRVGEKMYGLSRGRQVISVTHLAQIACLADNNYLIKKSFDEDRVVTEVKRLEGGERVNEISRLLGDEMAAEASRKLASEMLQRAETMKRASEGCSGI